MHLIFRKTGIYSETHLLVGLVFFVLWLPFQAKAYESFPQFRALQQKEVSEFDDPSRITPEYTSDWLSFLKPLEWEYDWVAHSQGYDLSIGSLSSKHFYIDNRLKIEEKLLDHFEFRFSYLSQRNFEVDSEHHILELIYWLQENWGLSVYGESSLYKAEDDIGLALLIQPSSQHEIRLFHTWVDFSRNERNTHSDRFNDTPQVFGLRGTWNSPLESPQKEFVDYSLRIHSPSEWHFPGKNLLYRHNEQFFQLEFLKALDETWGLGGRFQCQAKSEEKLPSNSTSSQVQEHWKSRRCINQLSLQWNWRGHEIQPGLSYIYREWEKDNEDLLIFRHTSPFLWWTLPEKGPEHFRRQWHVGWESTHHRGPAQSPLLEEEWEQDFTEHRMNLRYDMKFSDRSALSFLFTFDLDRFGTGETWEGGNGQFQLFF